MEVGTDVKFRWF